MGFTYCGFREECYTSLLHDLSCIIGCWLDFISVYEGDMKRIKADSLTFGGY